MKFPTAEPLFPSLSPTPDDCRRYELLAKAIVQDTVADYDQYVHEHQRQVSKQRWKGVKSREGIAVYKARDHDPRDNIHRGLASGLTGVANALTPELLDHFPAVEYNLPKLLMVGTIPGTLDDVMYGLSTHDTSSILLKAAYTQDEIVDGQILYQFEGPSPARPYKFLGIKWVVKGNPLVVNAIVAPRDLLFLNTIGILNRDNGERLGYILIHSVELAEVPSLQQHGIVRGRLSTSYVFKQLRDDCVEVYMKGYIEPMGKLVESVAINSAVTGLLFCWKAVVCSRSKKIVWLLRQKANQRAIAGGASSLAFPSFAAPPTDCSLCHRNLKVFNSTVECELCEQAMCSRCRVTMKLCFEAVGVKQVETRNVVICKSCITLAHQSNTLEVAEAEVRSGRFGLSFASSDRSSSTWDPQLTRTYSAASSVNMAAAKPGMPRAKADRRKVSAAETTKSYPYSEGSGSATSPIESREAAVRPKTDLYEFVKKNRVDRTQSPFQQPYQQSPQQHQHQHQQQYHYQRNPSSEDCYQYQEQYQRKQSSEDGFHYRQQYHEQQYQRKPSSEDVYLYQPQYPRKQSSEDGFQSQQYHHEQQYQHQRKPNSEDDYQLQYREQQYREQPRKQSSVEAAYEGWSNEKQELWQRMEQLRMQVDGAYNLSQHHPSERAPPPPPPQQQQPGVYYMRDSID